jgi:hypothetical protein
MDYNITQEEAEKLVMLLERVVNGASIPLDKEAAIEYKKSLDVAKEYETLRLCFSPGCCWEFTRKKFDPELRKEGLTGFKTLEASKMYDRTLVFKRLLDIAKFGILED